MQNFVEILNWKESGITQNLKQKTKIVEFWYILHIYSIYANIYKYIFFLNFMKKSIRRRVNAVFKNIKKRLK